MRKLSLFLLLFWNLALYAGGENRPIGARAAGLGQAAITLTDVWSAHHNQAGLGYIRRFSAGAYYESRFLVPELGLSGLAVAMPVGKGSLGLSIRNFGYQLYQENKIGLGYGRRFGDQLSIGMQLNMHTVTFQEPYGSTIAISAEVGAQYRVGKAVTLAAHVFNPTQTRLAEFDNERIPSAIRFGAQYRFSPKVFVVGEIESTLYTKPSMRAGFEYRPVEALYVRAGLAGNPFNSSFGFGVRWKRLQMDFAGTFHQVLGFTPRFSLTFQPGEE
jgi:hypothetical protein